MKLRDLIWFEVMYTADKQFYNMQGKRYVKNAVFKQKCLNIFFGEHYAVCCKFINKCMLRTDARLNVLLSFLEL